MKFQFKFFVAICIFFSSLTVVAQQENTLYYMERIPQSHYLNPAHQPDCKFWMSSLLIPTWLLPMPFVYFPMHFDGSVPLDINDFIIYEGGKPKKLFWYDESTQSAFSKKLKKYNYASMNMSVEEVFFGFKVNKNTFTFSMNTHLGTNISFSKGWFDLIMNGNVDDNGNLREIDLSGTAINASAYHEVAFGYNRQVNKYLRVGIRPKVLFGIVNFSTPEAELILDSRFYDNVDEKNPYPYVIRPKANYVINASNISLSEGEDFMDLDNLVHSAYSTKNMGLGVDLGLMKDWNSELTLHASVVDLGFIKWKNNVRNYSLTTSDSLKFDGVEMQPNLEDLSADSIFEGIVDNISFKESRNTYTTSLATKIYAGGEYKFTKKLSAGLVGKLQKYPYNFEFSATASANYRMGKWGIISGSYSYSKRSFANIGGGYTIRIGPIQWYAVFDNLIGPLLFTTSTKYFSVRSGVNLVFGRMDKKKKPAQRKNSPLLWTL